MSNKKLKTSDIRSGTCVFTTQTLVFVINVKCVLYFGQNGDIELEHNHKGYKILIKNYNEFRSTWRLIK